MTKQTPQKRMYFEYVFQYSQTNWFLCYFSEISKRKQYASNTSTCVFEHKRDPNKWENDTPKQSRAKKLIEKMYK